WPLTHEKLRMLYELVDKQLQQGHIGPTTSPWNTPVFITKKKNGKWRLLHDLRQVNAVTESMGALQPGLPSPTTIPANWPVTVLDLKDCFFTIPLVERNGPKFAFSIPSVNQSKPMKRYHWVVLPQGMKNSPTICQMYVAQALSGMKLKYPQMLIYHYMDDTLLAEHLQSPDLLARATEETRAALSAHGLQIAPEKVQKEQPWKYLGWKISMSTVQPQRITLRTEIQTLNDLQRLLGSINWVRPLLGIDNIQLSPLFDIL
ncbi:POK18 protein, partial [Corythaeola cristata]|nr:POK18 protein [Corythaeola cristata]